MYLRFEDNPNCGWVDDRVFNTQTDPQAVTQVLRRRDGVDLWCPVTGVEADGRFVPAYARKVDDSGEGTCWLVFGGLWGVRLRIPDCSHGWSLQDNGHQWGEGFLLLPATGDDLRLA
jgi:hypothetical protein